MKKATLTLIVLAACSLFIVSCGKSDKDDDNNNNSNLPTVSFTVSGAVSDDVQYSNTTAHSLQANQGNGLMTLTGMGTNYSFSFTVAANDVSVGTFQATQGQYINNSSGTQTFGELTSGQVEISSITEAKTGGSTALRVEGSFNMAISDAGGNGAVQIQGTFSNLIVQGA
jgi:hypothetical protein